MKIKTSVRYPASATHHDVRLHKVRVTHASCHGWKRSTRKTSPHYSLNLARGSGLDRLGSVRGWKQPRVHIVTKAASNKKHEEQIFLATRFFQPEDEAHHFILASVNLRKQR